MKIRKNITISDTMLERGDDVAKARGFDDFSEMISALIREEYERRGLDAPSVMRDTPPPYTVTKVERKGKGKKAKTAPKADSPNKGHGDTQALHKGALAAIQKDVEQKNTPPT